MTETRQYDLLNRLTSIASVGTGSAPSLSSFAYQYNQANQLTRATLQDGSFWVYEYDRLGQVVSGKRYWIDGTPVPGQQFEYGLDDIGNRGSAKWGGNTPGTGLCSALYTNNTLNQLTGRGVPGGFDVMGIANAGASVTVNSSPADYRRDEYFQEAVSVANTTSPVWQNVAVTASQSGSSSNWPAGSVFVPRTGELFGHDTDGNLTNDGRWAYTWDGENRLVRMVANTAVGPQQRLDFEYDWQGRRIRKVVWPNTGGTGTPTGNLLFVYDGWNLVAELNATNKTVIRSYVWGLDLSGSEQGAGGVGGLLAVKPGNGVAQFAAYDGNGNVTALVDGTAGTYTARYEYGPFGEPIRVSGTHGSANPFRFSTKLTDDETGLVYYGYRYYNPSTGRWPNRDPIEEFGGLNLYGMLNNDPVGRWDYLGLLELTFFYKTEIETATVTYPNVPGLRKTFNGGLKTAHTVSVDPDACKITWESKYVGITIEYDSAGNEKARARGSGDTLKASARRGFIKRCICIVKMKGNESNPLVRGAPGITYDVKIKIDTSVRQYKWEVEHDGFPSHEFWGHMGSPLYSFSHVAAGTTPADLFPKKGNRKASGNVSY